MNPLELRYEIYRPLTGLSRNSQIKDAELINPVPGEPVKIRVRTVDPTGKPRVYTVSISEDQAEPNEPLEAHNCVFGDACPYNR